jgi:hypothetical protein
MIDSKLRATPPKRGMQWIIQLALTLHAKLPNTPPRKHNAILRAPLLLPFWSAMAIAAPIIHAEKLTAK